MTVNGKKYHDMMRSRSITFSNKIAQRVSLRNLPRGQGNGNDDDIIQQITGINYSGSKEKCDFLMKCGSF